MNNTHVSMRDWIHVLVGAWIYVLISSIFFGDVTMASEVSYLTIMVTLVHLMAHWTKQE